MRLAVTVQGDMPSPMGSAQVYGRSRSAAQLRDQMWPFVPSSGVVCTWSSGLCLHTKYLVIIRGKP